jgi:hypothetical protein
MQLVILAPVPVKETPKDSFVVEIESMQGDADGYREFSVGPFKKDQDEAPLQSLLETLKRMETGLSNGMRGNRTYNNVLGHLQWFGTELVTIEFLQEYYPEVLNTYGAEAHQELIKLTENENHYAEWHGDAMTGYQHDEKLTKYEVMYYDEAGIKHAVQINWEA